MASCKDCLHVEVCREYVMGLAAARGVELNEADVLSDKSEFSPDSIDVPLNDFRDRFFTSREDAEQALKEREKDE